MSLTIVHSKTLGTTKDSTVYDINSPEWNASHLISGKMVNAVSLGGNTGGVLTEISSGTVHMEGGNNITLSQNGNTVVISGPNSVSQSVQPCVQSLNGSTGPIVLTAGDNITLSQNLSTVTIHGRTDILTTAMQSDAGSQFIYSSAGKNLTNISVTLGSNSISLSVGNYITTAMETTERSNYIASSAGKNLTNISVTLGSNSISLSVGNYITTGMESNAGSRFVNTSAGTNGTNVNMTFNSNSISISVHAPQTGISGIAGSGASTVTNGTVQFSNANGISFGLNGSTMTASHNALTTAMNTTERSNFVNSSATVLGYNISATVSSNGLTISANDPSAAAEANWHNISSNTVGQSTFSGSTIMLIAGNNITLSGVNASQIRLDAGGGGGGYTDMSYMNRELGASTTMSHGQNSLWLTPFRLVVPLSASTCEIAISYSGTITSAATAQHGETWYFALYSQNATNSTRFDTYWTSQRLITAWNSGTSSGSFNYGGTTSSSAGSNLLTASFMGVRLIGVPIGSTLSTGLYLMAIRMSSSTAGYSAHMSRIARYFDSPMSIGVGSMNQATASSIGIQKAGVYSVTTGGLPSSIGMSEIRKYYNIAQWFKIGAE